MQTYIPEQVSRNLPGLLVETMDGIDKAAMGQRIKEIRKAVDLRQWQLAEILGTTQSAVHKYERGVIPEPRRLIELARLGSSSVEWILTGRHWENGSEDRTRIDQETFRLAVALRTFDENDRKTVDDAMRVLAEAASRLQRETGRDLARIDHHELAGILKGYQEDSRRILAAALAVHRSVLRSVVEMQESRFADTASAPSSGNRSTAEADDEEAAAGEKKTLPA